MKKNIDNFENLVEVSNEESLKGTPVKRAHDVKIEVNNLMKIANDSKIPIFVAYYAPGKGYIYDGLFPEEIEDAEDLKEQYGKFMKFLKVCIDFNKEDYKPIIKSIDSSDI